MVNIAIRSRKIHCGFERKSSCHLSFRHFNTSSGISNHLEDTEEEHHLRLGLKKKKQSLSFPTVKIKCCLIQDWQTQLLSMEVNCTENVFYSFPLLTPFSCYSLSWFLTVMWFLTVTPSSCVLCVYMCIYVFWIKQNW